MLIVSQHINVGNRYSVLSLVYFISYLLLQVSHTCIESLSDLSPVNCRAIYSYGK